MVVLVAVMITVNAAFTLTGLAGLALAVGMAVDNNVLLYERMREELHRGATIRMAIRNAFHRVGVVIVDANLTHLIAATVLFVRGHASRSRASPSPSSLGAVLSLWTSLFVARVVFEIAERKHWLTKLKMLHVIGDTHIDFMAWFPAAADLLDPDHRLAAWRSPSTAARGSSTSTSPAGCRSRPSSATEGHRRRPRGHGEERLEGRGRHRRPRPEAPRTRSS